MKKIMQARLGIGGDCTSACLATVMGLELEAVPKFHPPGGTAPDYWEQLERFLRGHGLGVLCLRPGPNDPVGVLCLAGGPSPRGPWGHHVVWRTGHGLVHDPHPDGTGLAGDPDELLYLVPLEREELYAEMLRRRGAAT